MWDEFMKDNQINTTIFSFVPSQYDQILFVQSDNEMLEALKTIQGEIVVAEMEPILKHTKQLILWQYFDSVEQYDYSLLLFAMNNPQNIEKMIESGVLYTWDDVTYEELAPWYYMYGEELSRTMQKKAPKNLLDNQTINRYLNIFWQENAHIAYIAKPEGLFGLENNPLFASFAQSLQTTFAWSKIKRDVQEWSLLLTFNKPIGKPSKKPWKWRLATFVKQSVPMYVEIHDLLTTFEISDAQFSSVFPVLLWEQSAFVSVLSANDLNTLYTALDSPFSLTIARSNIPWLWWVWATLMFSNSDIFTIFQKVWPFMKAWLEETVGMGSLRVQQWTDIWAFSIAWDNAFIPDTDLLRIERKNWWVEVAILGWKSDIPANRDASLASAMEHDEHAMVWFYIDITQMNTLFQTMNSWINLLWLPMPSTMNADSADPVQMKWSIVLQEWWKELKIKFATDQ
jgi:hypothetical protein